MKLKKASTTERVMLTFTKSVRGSRPPFIQRSELMNTLHPSVINELINIQAKKPMAT